jgi:hypothetical protein
MQKALLTFSLLIFLSTSQSLKGQWAQDFTNMIEISNVKAMEASSSHLYVLSELEGMAVFRIHSDSLQWLYTSSGMQRRGDKLESDIRFGYLYGESRRLTVLEPTSVLGVFSSTQLPVPPLGVARLGDKLYVALNEEGLGELSLTDPDLFDNEPEIAQNGIIGRAAVIDVASSIVANQLFVLTNDDRILLFKMEEGVLSHTSSINLDEPVNRLFVQEDKIWASSALGEIYSITTNGIGQRLGEVDAPVSSILQVDGDIIVRTQNQQLWISQSNDDFKLWQAETSSGNFIAKSDDAVWVSFFDRISSLTSSSNEASLSISSTQSSGFNIKDIQNKTLTFPQPLLIGLELENGDLNDVTFTYRSSVANATIKKQGLYWQPSVNQIGVTPFTIIATNSSGAIDSTSFTVEIKTFNAPPRFSPIRGSTIAIDDPYELTFNAIDPENPSSTLIRYLGVDLPTGSTLNERTGLFSWTPTERQLGEQTFRIVATDEQGTAASIDVTFTVVNLSRGK